MSQFGMQLPGGRLKRGASPDVFTALAALSVVFLIAACVVMFGAASKVSKEKGNPFALQDDTSTGTGKIDLPNIVNK
jgi:hypothetical protein